MVLAVVMRSTMSSVPKERRRVSSGSWGATGVAERLVCCEPLGGSIGGTGSDESVFCACGDSGGEPNGSGGISCRESDTEVASGSSTKLWYTLRPEALDIALLNMAEPRAFWNMPDPWALWNMSEPAALWYIDPGVLRNEAEGRDGGAGAGGAALRRRSETAWLMIMSW
jgi:hypothetical protein